MARTPPHLQLRQDLVQIARRLPPGGRLEFDVHPDHLWLHILYLPPTHRGGRGTELMAQVLECVDRAGLPVNLTADPTDQPGDPDSFALVKWYSKFGFQLFAMNAEEVALMERGAKRPQRAAEILKDAKGARFTMTREEYDAWAEKQYRTMDASELSEPVAEPRRLNFR